MAAGGALSALAGGTTSEPSGPVFNKLHDFDGTNGYWPRIGMVAGADGALYGVTEQGGPNNRGTVFRLGTNGTFTKLHDFDGSNGFAPAAALVRGPDGALYGSTYYGGTTNFQFGGGYGTLFRAETNGRFATLHYFDETDGANPYVPLVVGADGALYGHTLHGGASHRGTLFRIETNGAFTKLIDFTGTNGSYPWAPMVVGPDGALYGSTAGGGAGEFGTLFRRGMDGTFTTLFSFGGTNGLFPYPALAVGSDGALYGSTLYGGESFTDIHTNIGFGTLFRIQTNGNYAKLIDLNGLDGSMFAPLVTGSDGALYGATSEGGTNYLGTLFRLKTDGTFTTIYEFDGTNGAHPTGLVKGPDGALYGTAGGGSAYLDPDNLGAGILFRLEANGVLTHLFDFDFTNGAGPEAPLVVGPDQALYGSTMSGGVWQNGTLFKLVVDLDKDHDGVPDSVDQCPDTAPGDVVDATGCSIAQLVPCEGPRTGGRWKNHGQYVRAVTETATKFIEHGLITRPQWSRIVANAARSECGSERY